MSNTGAFTIPGAPAIPGLAFRRFRGEADYPEMLRVREGCRERDQLDPHAPRAGVEDIRIITDAQDGRGARSLYESLGFRALKEHVLYRKPMKLTPALAT